MSPTIKYSVRELPPFIGTNVRVVEVRKVFGKFLHIE